MQEFLTNDTVNCNLMSLTGYRTLVILRALMESPKTNDEINDCLFNNKYIKERFSGDTLRMYINALRAIGCDITKANKSNQMKYKLLSHPFAYKITESQLKAIAKFYKSVYDKLEIKDIILIEDFFETLSHIVQDSCISETLSGFCRLKKINRNLLEELLVHARSKNQIKFIYESPRSGKKEIEIVADKIAFKSGRLYLWGTNLNYGQYSYFSVEKIVKIICIKLRKENQAVKLFSKEIVYELYNFSPPLIEEERVIEKDDEKCLIALNCKNEFDAVQRLLFLAEDCKVISPEDIKEKFLTKLKGMGEVYNVS